MDQLLNEKIALVKEVDNIFVDIAKKRLSEQARPVGSLGILEGVSAKLAGIKKSLDIKLNNKKIIVCAGDHGIVEEGVSLFPQEVTPQMVFNFVNNGASINVLAKHAGASVCVADIGVNYDFPKDLKIFHKKVRKGTNNFTKNIAMTRDEAIKSILNGIEVVEEIVEKENIDIIGVGDMGIGNTTPSAAIISSFSGIAVEKLTGYGTGISDLELKKKVDVIKTSLKKHAPDPNDPIDVLSKVGGLEIGGIAGVVIGAAIKNIPVICDGLISTAGALIAYKLQPLIKSYLFASHNSVEIGHKYMLDEIGLTPLLDLHFRLGEGTGAALAMELIDASTRILADIKTFEEVEIINQNSNSKFI